MEPSRIRSYIKFGKTERAEWVGAEKNYGVAVAWGVNLAIICWIKNSARKENVWSEKLMANVLMMVVQMLVEKMGGQGMLDKGRWATENPRRLSYCSVAEIIGMVGEMLQGVEIDVAYIYMYVNALVLTNGMGRLTDVWRGLNLKTGRTLIDMAKVVNGDKGGGSCLAWYCSVRGDDYEKHILLVAQPGDENWDKTADETLEEVRRR